MKIRTNKLNIVAIAQSKIEEEEDPLDAYIKTIEKMQHYKIIRFIKNF